MTWIKDNKRTTYLILVIIGIIQFISYLAEVITNWETLTNFRKFLYYPVEFIVWISFTFIFWIKYKKENRDH